MGELSLLMLQFFIGLMLVSAVLYVLSSLTYMKLAKKAGVKNAWAAWVPYGQYYISIKLAGVSLMEMLIPVGCILTTAFVEDFVLILIASVIVLIWIITVDRKILERFGMDSSLAFLHLIPGVGSLIVLIVLMNLAFKKEKPQPELMESP